MSVGIALAKAASEFVGCPFRLRGRDPEIGFDCIGLLLAALERIGRPMPTLPRYHLRNSDWSNFASLLPIAGLHSCGDPVMPGDVHLLTPSPAQFHLAISGLGDDLIHAHAGLRRVAISPAPLPWPCRARWRLAEV